jgi:hypothetical protein
MLAYLIQEERQERERGRFAEGLLPGDLNYNSDNMLQESAKSSGLPPSADNCPSLTPLMHILTQKRQKERI